MFPAYKKVAVFFGEQENVCLRNTPGTAWDQVLTLSFTGVTVYSARITSWNTNIKIEHKCKFNNEEI